MEPRYNKSEIFKNAWVLVKEQRLTMSEALKKCYMLVKLQIKLTHGIAVFTFRKKNGEIRKAAGTLIPGIVNPRIAGTGIDPAQYRCQLFFDVDANGFRCFRYENILSVE